MPNRKQRRERGLDKLLRGHNGNINNKVDPINLLTEQNTRLQVANQQMAKQLGAIMQGVQPVQINLDGVTYWVHPVIGRAVLMETQGGAKQRKIIEGAIEALEQSIEYDDDNLECEKIDDALEILKHKIEIELPPELMPKQQVIQISGLAQGN